MRNRRSICPLALVVLLALACTAAGQTVGLPFVNDLFIDVGATAALVGPPGGIPCTMVPPFVMPPATPFVISLTTPAPGLAAIIFVDLAPCAPAFLCLPAVFGPYGGIPPAVLCPAITITALTNQSIDIAMSPALAALFVGLTFPVFVAPGAILSTPVFVSPPFPLGLIISLQAVFFDTAGGSPFFGMVVSNAIEIAL